MDAKTDATVTRARSNRYNDLRDLVETFDATGELKRVEGACKYKDLFS